MIKIKTCLILNVTSSIITKSLYEFIFLSFPSEAMEIQILLERFATQHAIGVVGYSELDAKVENTQKIAVAVSGTEDTPVA